RPVPCDLAVLQRAARREAREIVAPALRKRQHRGERTERPESEMIEREIAVGRRAARSLLVAQAEIGVGKAAAVALDEREALGVDLAPAAVLASRDAAGDVLQGRGRQVVGETRLDIDELDIGRDGARLAIR